MLTIPSHKRIFFFSNKTSKIISAAGEVKIKELKDHWWAKEFEKSLPAPERYSFLIETCKVEGHNGISFFLPFHQ